MVLIPVSNPIISATNRSWNNSQPAILEIYFRGFDNSTGIDMTYAQKKPGPHGVF